jgi:DNA-directed RNA polymerase specialized sigma24 family protein
LTLLKQEEEGYELFRRAIVYRDADAWAAIHACYRSLLLSWAYRCGAGIRTADSAEDIADQALARAWLALKPADFDAFPSLARLLGYLRTCVATTVIDSTRTRAAAERAEQALQILAPATPEQTVLATLDCDALWRAAVALAAESAERVILVESLVYGLPPRMIWARHPQIFPDIATIYSTKRSLFNRLQCNPELLRLREEISAV